MGSEIAELPCIQVERRKIVRQGLELFVRFDYQNGITSNGSPFGLFVRTIRPPAAGCGLAVFLRVLGRPAIVLRGRVIHNFLPTARCTDPAIEGFGFQILDPSPEYERLIARLERNQRNGRSGT